jgi:hypothetical protein
MNKNCGVQELSDRDVRLLTEILSFQTNTCRL